MSGLLIGCEGEGGSAEANLTGPVVGEPEESSPPPAPSYSTSCLNNDHDCVAEDFFHAVEYEDCERIAEWDSSEGTIFKFTSDTSVAGPYFEMTLNGSGADIQYNGSSQGFGPLYCDNGDRCECDVTVDGSGNITDVVWNYDLFENGMWNNYQEVLK
jgi:hypothetical protein